MTQNIVQPDWVQFDVLLPEELSDPVSNYFIEHGCKGVVENVAEEGVILTAYVPFSDRDVFERGLSAYLSDLENLFPKRQKPVLTVKEIPTENWAVMWKDNFHTLEIGEGLIITPPWLPVSSVTRKVIVIEPAEAFGTGTHETTQSCLVLLEQAFTLSEMSASMLDVGCGSGILAIAAAQLGAVPVLGVDNDPVAIKASVSNLELNNLTGKVAFQCSSVSDISGTFSIVAANLDYNTLHAHWSSLKKLVGKFLIISGITNEQWSDILKLIGTADFRLEKDLPINEWMSGLFVRK